MPNAKTMPSPMPIAQDLLWGGWSAMAAGAAVELDLFTIIHRGKTTAAEIASEANTHESSTRRLLDAMVALKYLTRKKDRYGLTHAAATFLVRSSNLYMEGGGKFASGHLMGWTELAQAVRTGAAVITDEPGARGEFFSMLVRCIFPSGYAAATAAVNSLDRAARANPQDPGCRGRGGRMVDSVRAGDSRGARDGVGFAAGHSGRARIRGKIRRHGPIRVYGRRPSSGRPRRRRLRSDHARARDSQ